MPATIETIRRENLRLLVEEHGNSPSKLAQKLGYANGSFIVQMKADPPTPEQIEEAKRKGKTVRATKVSEETARKIEDSLGLPDGWMDVPHRPGERSRGVMPANSNSNGHDAAPRLQGADVSVNTVFEAMHIVNDMNAKHRLNLSYVDVERLAMVIVNEAQRTGRVPSADFLDGLLAVLKAR